MLTPYQLGYGFGTVVGIAGYTCLGYLYGAMFNADKKLAAKAVAILSTTQALFNLLNGFVTGGPEQNKKAYYFNATIGKLIIESVAIIAFRRLNLIAERGTIVLSCLTTTMTIIRLRLAVRE